MAVSQALYLTCTGQNQVQNTSQVLVQWDSTQTGASYNDKQRTAYYYVSVNGGTETQYSVNYTLPQNSTKAIVATTITVPHNDMGEATVTVRTWMNTHISAGVVEKKTSLTLPTIARESTVSGTAVTIGGKTLVTVNRKSSGFTHTVYLQFGSIGGYLKADGSLSGTAVKLTSASIIVPIGEEYYAQIPSALSGTVTLTCTTYSGSTQIGSPKTANFTVHVDPAYNDPELVCSAEDVEQRTEEITGDNQIFINGFSTVRVYAKAQGVNYATIRSVTVNGQEITGEYLDIPNFSGTSLTVTAVDSRGLATSRKLSNTIIPYTMVTLNATVERTDGTGSTATLKLSGNWYQGGIGQTVNLLSASYRVGSGETVELFANEYPSSAYGHEATVTGLEYNKTYSLTVTVSDCLTSVTRTLTVKKGEPVFDWGENDFTFHVPVSFQDKPTFPEAFWRQVYPVGSIYMSMNATSPETLFGGTWERIRNQFLLAASATSYPVGTTGGEATHNLTIEEMPWHDHTEFLYCNYGGGNKTVSGNFIIESAQYVSWSAADRENINIGTAGETTGVGGSQAHNNMPPYLAVYMWYRTA